MKKKINKQPNVHKIQPIVPERCRLCIKKSSRKQQKSIFQVNYELISKTINEAMQKQAYSALITKILQREPSKQLIAFQQIEKNLVFQEYLQKFNRFDKIPDKMRILVPKHVPNVKANYMDFKIKNFLILNKYKVLEKANLPYPLCIKFQKLTDSKMSSTKSVQNKVLQQLQKQLHQNHLTNRQSFVMKDTQKTKKLNKNKRQSNDKFQIKKLTKSIGQMIQHIKDVRALQNFKRQMQKSSQFKFGIQNFEERQTKEKKKTFNKQILKIPNKQVEIHELKEKQFKRRVEDDMGRYFPDQKKRPQLVKKSTHQPNFPLPLTKNSKNKFSYKSTERLQTNPGPDIEEYGLSIIREKRKKSKSKQDKSRSKESSRKSKQGSSHFQFPANKRLDTQYSSSSPIRLNTGHSMLMKSKSTSRIPTEYDSDVIIKSRKSKSKSKQQRFLFQNLAKKQSKSSSISQQAVHSVHNFKKSKSKSKPNLLQFNSSSSKVLNKK